MMNSDWFVDGGIRKVRSSFQTSFLNDPWLGIIPLKIKLPCLFSNSLQPNGMVGKIDGGIDLLVF